MESKSTFILFFDKVVCSFELFRLLISDNFWQWDPQPGSSTQLSLVVTPVFPKKTKCKPICMPGSKFHAYSDI
jgi:hypothetical protein